MNEEQLRIATWRAEQLKVVPEFNCTAKISSIFKYCVRQYNDTPLEIEVYNLLPLFLGWDPNPLAFNNTTTLINIELSFEAFDALVHRKGQKFAMSTIRDFGIGHVEVPRVPLKRRRLTWELDMTEEAKQRCDFYPVQLKKSGSWLHPSVFEVESRPRIELDFFDFEPDSPRPLAVVSGLPPKTVFTDLRAKTRVPDQSAPANSSQRACPPETTRVSAISPSRTSSVSE